MMQKVRKRLKQHTSQAHENLHIPPLLCSLLTNRVTLKQYCIVLGAFYRFYSNLDIQLVRNGYPGLVGTELKNLQQDMSFLNINLMNFPPLFFPQTSLSNDDIYGIRYGVLGSRKGG